MEKRFLTLRELHDTYMKLRKDVNGHEESIKFLVEYSVTRDELQQEMDKKMYLLESRIFSAIDGLSKLMKDSMEEISYNRHHHNELDHRVVIIENKLGLPSAI